MLKPYAIALPLGERLGEGVNREGFLLHRPFTHLSPRGKEPEDIHTEAG
jgi:hypothetical protein